jgi:hypothetical protein
MLARGQRGEGAEVSPLRAPRRAGHRHRAWLALEVVIVFTALTACSPLSGARPTQPTPWPTSNIRQRTDIWEQQFFAHISEAAAAYEDLLGGSSPTMGDAATFARSELKWLRSHVPPHEACEQSTWGWWRDYWRGEVESYGFPGWVDRPVETRGALLSIQTGRRLYTARDSYDCPQSDSDTPFRIIP